MYKVASDRKQTSLHRGRPRDWINGQEQLSTIDKLQLLQNGCKILEQRIQSLPKGEERSLIGQEKFQIQQQISALKKEVGKDYPLEWKSFFINEAKRILSDSQFQMIFNAAKRECKLAEERLGRKSDC